MSYTERSCSGEAYRGASAIRAYHETLPAAERSGLLWRLANQALVSDIVVELHAAGYADVDLGASVRATSCTFYLDLRPQTLRVLLRVGIFVAGPGPTEGEDEEPLQIAAVEAGLVLQVRA